IGYFLSTSPVHQSTHPLTIVIHSPNNAGPFHQTHALAKSEKSHLPSRPPMVLRHPSPSRFFSPSLINPLVPFSIYPCAPRPEIGQNISSHQSMSANTSSLNPEALWTKPRNPRPSPVPVIRPIDQYEAAWPDLRSQTSAPPLHSCRRISPP